MNRLLTTLQDVAIVDAISIRSSLALLASALVLACGDGGAGDFAPLPPLASETGFATHDLDRFGED